MRILYMHTRSDVGGATVHVRDLAQSFMLEGHDVLVLHGGNGRSARQLEERGIPHQSVSDLVQPPDPARDLLALAEIIRRVRAFQPDIVSAHTAKAGLLGRMACSMLRIPAVFTSHGWSVRSERFGGYKRRCFCLMEQVAARCCERIVNVCEHERQIAIQNGITDLKKLVVIHNGMPDIPRSLRADTSPQPPRIIMTARFEEPKDHATLLGACALLKANAWELELVGEGPLKPEMTALAAQLGLQTRVKFSGASDEVAPQLAAAQIFVLSSNCEAFPRSILEAMRAGLPVIASDVGGVRESVLHGLTGYVVPRGNIMAMHDALATLINNASLRGRMGAAGRLHYENRFTYESMKEKVSDLYQQILAKRRALPGPT